MPDLSTWGSLVLGGAGLITSCLAIYYARSNKIKIEAEARRTSSESDINSASAKEIEEKAAMLSDERYRAREQYWADEVQKVKSECHSEVEDLRREVAWLKILIEQHVPWDWEQQRKMTMAGIEHEPPPTLVYTQFGKHGVERKSNE